MIKLPYIPSSPKDAAKHLRYGFAHPLESLTPLAFSAVWSSVAYLYPGLHPDEWDNPEGGWPKGLRKFAAEAARRVHNGEMIEDEFYPSDAQWAGLYDRMIEHHPEEIQRRVELSRHY